jgi:hypothetical protein
MCICEKKVIFDAWPSFSFSSGSGRRFKVVVSLVLVVGGLTHLPARGKNKKICACASSSEHHMCSVRVVLYACNIHT